MWPPVKGFIENTLLDWEGKVASVIFLPGCNFRCGFCHARHLIESMPVEETIPLEAILLALRRQRGWIDGVVISGGEPTLHEGLFDLIDAFRRESVPVKLDTNGSHPEVLERLLQEKRVEYVAMDVKAPLNHRYAEVVRAPVNLDALRQSIELLIGGDIPYEFRSTLCPALHSAEDVEGIARAVRGAKTLFLQNFRPLHCFDRELETGKPFNGDQMREFCKQAARFVQRCAVRGDQASEVVTATVAR